MYTHIYTQIKKILKKHIALLDMRYRFVITTLGRQRKETLEFMVSKNLYIKSQQGRGCSSVVGGLLSMSRPWVQSLALPKLK